MCRKKWHLHQKGHFDLIFGSTLQYAQNMPDGTALCMPMKYVAFEDLMLLTKKSESWFQLCSNSITALEQKLISLEKTVPKLHEQRAEAIWILEGYPTDKNRMAVDAITQKLIAISYRVQTKMENN